VPVRSLALQFSHDLRTQLLANAVVLLGEIDAVRNLDSSRPVGFQRLINQRPAN
jgi:hypothetical protein